MGMPKTIKLSTLTPDDKNANKGTSRGSFQLERSLRAYGAGRSITVDKNGRIISGNKTAETAMAIGMDDAVVVESSGDKVIVHKRTDIDLGTSKGRALAIADNRIGELNLDWDMDVLSKLGDEVDLFEFFHPSEIASVIEQGEADVDYDKEWEGMPEFSQENQHPVRQIVVSFESDEHVAAFGKLIGANITEKTKSVYYPVQPRKSAGIYE